MKRNKLDKLKREGERLRRSAANAEALQKYAKSLGRKLAKRGKEPTWLNKEFPTLRPLSIPDHGGKDLAIGTKNSILNQLEDDQIAWDEKITSEEAKHGE